jgi:hypothetical protein
MAENQEKPRERDIIWLAFRRFGEAAWDGNASAKGAGKPRIRIMVAQKPFCAPDLNLRPVGCASGVMPKIPTTWIFGAYGLHAIDQVVAGVLRELVMLCCDQW